MQNRHSNTDEIFVYIGSYNHWLPWLGGTAATFPSEGGIAVCHYSRNTQELTLRQTINTIKNPSFLAYHPQGHVLYSNSEIADFDNHTASGGLAAFSRHPLTGELSLMNMRPSLGIDPCYLTIDPSGQILIAANYNSGSLVVYALNTDGSLANCLQHIEYQGHGPHWRQEAAHIHTAIFSPDTQKVFITDLGADKIYCYRFNALARLKENHVASVNPACLVLETVFNLPSGSGPRHLAYHPTKPLLYVVYELTNTVSVLTLDNFTHQPLKVCQTLSTLPRDYRGENLASDIHFSPDGRYLLVANRGHDSLVIYPVAESGKLEEPVFTFLQGSYPRQFHFNSALNTLFCANQRSHSVSVFSWQTALPYLRLQHDFLQVTNPACVISLPS